MPEFEATMREVASFSTDLAQVLTGCYKISLPIDSPENQGTLYGFTCNACGMTGYTPTKAPRSCLRQECQRYYQNHNNNNNYMQHNGIQKRIHCPTEDCSFSFYVDSKGILNTSLNLLCLTCKKQSLVSEWSVVKQ